MARGRMLNRSISQDRVVAQLCNDVGLGAGVVFTWLIPHLDREGRTHGDPDVIKGQVFPRVAGITPEVIRQTLERAHDLGLVDWYEDGGDLYLSFPAFEANQVGLRKNREPESDLPAPPEERAAAPTGSMPANIRQPSGALTAEGKGKEGKGSEGKGSSAPSSSQPFLIHETPAETQRSLVPLSPMVLAVPLANGTEHPVTEADVQEWASAYPGVDVLAELQKLRQWNLSRPRNRKTARGIRAHITDWLGRTQDRGGPRGPPQQQLTRKGEEMRKAIEAGDPNMFRDVAHGKR